MLTSLNYQPWLLVWDHWKDIQNTSLLNRMLQIGTSSEWQYAIQRCPLLSNFTDRERQNFLKRLATKNSDDISRILNSKKQW